MLIKFSVSALRHIRQANPNTPAMSTPRRDANVKVVVGSVVRRPTAEVLEEMAALARQDRAKLGTPIPPAPRPQTGRFSIVRRPPLPRLPPINPFVPVSPERPLDVRVAAARAQARREEEKAESEREEWLRAWAYENAARPRTPSPPRDAEDHYDLARWNRQRWI